MPRKPISAQDLLESEAPLTADDELTGEELVRAGWAVRGLKLEMARQKAFWASTNQALEGAYDELERRTGELQQARERLAETNRELEVRVLEQTQALNRRGRLERFLPPQLVEELLDERAGAGLAQERRLVAVIVVELCGFDEVASQVDAEDLVFVFGRFHRLCTDAAFAGGGTLAGAHDTMVKIVYGAPKPLVEAEAVENAMRTAEALLVGSAPLSNDWAELHPELPLGLRGGVDVGHATVGILGLGALESFAAIGGPAARAPRLMERAARGELLVSARAARHVDPQRLHTELAFRPKALPTDSGPPVWALGHAPRPVRDTVVDRFASTLDVKSSGSGDRKAPASHRSGIVPGMRLGGRYKIEQHLGDGGMASVFRAEDVLLGQTVALKVLSDTAGVAEEMLTRFRREVRLARLIAHPNVCRVHDLAVLDGRACLTMELVEGESLRAAIRRHSIGAALDDSPRVTSERAVRWALQMCDGLGAAHACGIVHRDLKPENVLVEASTGRIVIADFGIARMAHTVSHTDSVTVTIDYSAPEQLMVEGPPDPRTDIFALGVVLFELVTGDLPYTGDTLMVRAMARCMRGPRDPATLVPDLDPGLRAVILRCMERSPGDRFSTASDVAGVLKLALRQVAAAP